MQLLSLFLNFYKIIFSCAGSNDRFFALFQYPLHASSVGFIPPQATQDYLFTGLYYGFAVVALLFNVFFYITFKDRKILYYIFLLATIVLSLAHEDGLLTNVFSYTFLYYSENFSHFLTGIAASVFALHLFKDKAFNVRLRTVSLVINAVIAGLYTASAISGDMLFSYLSDIILFVMFGVYLAAGIYTIKRDLPIRYFLVSYLLLFFMAFRYYVIMPLRPGFISVTHKELKAASILEMIVFLLVTLYRVYLLERENKLYKIEIVGAFIHEKESTGMQKESASDIDFSGISSRYGLTESELKVFKCIADGLSNTEISKKLFISVNTVKYHNRNIYEKLDIKSKSQAVSKILESQIKIN